MSSKNNCQKFIETLQVSNVNIEKIENNSEIFPISASKRILTIMKIGLTPKQLAIQIQKTLDEERQISYDNGYDQGLLDVADSQD